MTYYPKRPVKSFQDLEVYQKLLAIAVVIVKRTAPSTTSEVFPLCSSTSEVGNNALIQNMHECALSLPIKIAAAHSLRFGNTQQAVRILEEIMVGCNKIVVYLELYRDLYNKSTTSEVEEERTDGKTSEVEEIDHEFFEEQIKNILSVRFKILHLQRSWIKFTPSESKIKK